MEEQWKWGDQDGSSTVPVSHAMGAARETPQPAAFLPIEGKTGNFPKAILKGENPLFASFPTQPSGTGPGGDRDAAHGHCVPAAAQELITSPRVLLGCCCCPSGEKRSQGEQPIPGGTTGAGFCAREFTREATRCLYEREPAPRSGGGRDQVRALQASPLVFP